MLDETLRRSADRRLPGAVPAGLVFRQPGVERRLVAGRRARRQAGGPGARRHRADRRRLLHVRHAGAGAVGRGASRRAVHGRRLHQPQLLDRHDARSAACTARTATPPRSDFEGGYFDPPIDFAKEAEAAGAYGETVRDPAEVMPALQRGLAETGNGRCAVISMWLARLEGTTTVRRTRPAPPRLTPPERGL